jgi:OmcA/MtrC family decaheme c-type cytochrome
MEVKAAMLSSSVTRISMAVASIVLVAAALSSDETPAFRSTEKAYYADDAKVAFVRPGLVMKVTKGEISADGTIKATVKFTDPKGMPLDREGIQTPGPITVSFLIGYIPADATQYVSYITRVRVSGDRSVTQATGESTGVWAKIADGEYTYTFANKAPSTIDRSATHTIGIYGSRNLTEFELGTNRADATLNFVPSGAAVTKVRDIVRTATCNKCHDQLGLHGGNRRSVEVCILCHTPQTPDSRSDNTTDLKVMIHKIHMGAALPSVIAKQPYTIAGNDYSTVVNPSPNMACKVCHEPKSVSGAVQADNWLTKPSREACGSCHDDVNFATGDKHVSLPQFTDNQCSNCHPPQGEVDFDASIKGAHMVPVESSLLNGVVFTIEGVSDAAPGKNPTVTFTVKDKKGNPIQMSKMNSCRLYMGGSTTDIGTYVREDVLKASGNADGYYFWTFIAPIPADAKGSWQFGIEGYQTTTVLAGTLKQRTIRDYGMNKVYYASLDGSKPVPRRAVVNSATCNKCHYSLEFHGGNRNTAEMCTFCHNPTLTSGTPAESFNYANMIHRFHAEEVRYPGIITDCAQCHANGSQSLPLQAGLLPVKNPDAVGGSALPTTNACTSCHNTPEAWSHAKANTTTLGESCTVCHGSSSEFAVSKVHAQ